ncbi:twin-arginine translocase TatA/TatE family subunit [Paenibacillus sp. JZ16]|uniref:twin-arginine translocase TatA/TatE family subunit n=1 Tax=Paenibacillus sp. JZ16 TaxID=1906272 RepID=UPI00188CAF48|nr:twin-arginine translocase TatA/TatE family subunit [Paenibacillus sp. JZ16]
MPLNIGFTGLAVLILIGLLLFGPSKLPRLARAFGTTIKEFRRGSKEMLEEETAGSDADPKAAADAVGGDGKLQQNL